MARTIEVQIVGDSRELEKAFARSAKSAQQFNQQLGRSTLSTQAKAIREITAAEEQLVRIRSRRAFSTRLPMFATTASRSGAPSTTPFCTSTTRSAVFGRFSSVVMVSPYAR